MEFNQIIKILNARKWIVYQSIIIIFVVSMVATYVQKPVYQASVTILLKEKDISSSMLFGSLLNQPGGQLERSLQTQVKLLKLRPVLQEVIDKLRLKIKPEDLSKKIEIKSEGNANLLTVSVKDESPYRAEKIANTLVEQYLSSSRQSTTNELTRARTEVAKKLKDTEDNIIILAKEIQKKKKGDPVPDDLKAKMDMATGIYVMLAEKHEQLKISEELRTSDAVMVSPAIIPEKPISPKPLFTAIVSLIGGLMVGVAFALGVDQLDSRIRTVEDAESIFKLPVIGQIPYQEILEKSKEKIPVKTKPKSSAAEAYRTVRTNIEYFNAEKNMRTILITSANPQEGKSVFALNIAAAFAQGGKKVVLVSCDLRKPSVHEYLGIPNTTGLSNYLAGYTDIVDEILNDTSIRNLLFVSSGPVPPNPSELLGSKRMEHLINILAENADYIIFDSAPVLAVTDSSVLAKFSDGAVIVSDYTKTTKEEGRKVISALEKTGVRQLGVAINNVPMSIAYPYSSYRGYGYTYTNEGQPRQKGSRKKLAFKLAFLSIPAGALYYISILLRR